MSEQESLEPKCVRIWRGHTGDPSNYLGTGFLITRRQFVTAAHVVKDIDQDKLLVTGLAWGSTRTVREGSHFPETAGPRDLRRDIAVLELSKNEQTSQEPLPVSDDIYAIPNTAINLHSENPLSLRERVSVRGLKMKIYGREKYSTG